jgi:hypothetical protein
VGRLRHIALKGAGIATLCKRTSPRFVTICLIQHRHPDDHAERTLRLADAGLVLR